MLEKTPEAGVEAKEVIPDWVLLGNPNDGNVEGTVVTELSDGVCRPKENPPRPPAAVEAGCVETGATTGVC